MKPFQDQFFEESLPVYVREVYEELVAVMMLPPDSFEQFREPIEADLRQAYKFGIARRDGLIQFASYRYSIGEGWYNDPKIRQILELEADEARKWSLIDDLVEED